MKRIFPLLFFLLLMTGCSPDTVPQIEDHIWQMTSVQSMEANGQAIAYGEGDTSTLDTAKQIALICTAEDGILTLSDETNHKTYTVTYNLKGMDPRSANYEVTVDGAEGLAVVAMTAYHDGSQEPTFIINLYDYAVNFSAQQTERE